MTPDTIANGAGAQLPANASPRQKLEAILKYAALAPTERPWQRGTFRVQDTHLELVAQGDPARVAADPDGRELMIGCGAALLYLKLALKHFGCLGRVALFPDLGEPALVARIYAGSCHERNPQEKFLFQAMTESRTNRSPLGGTPVSETMLAALSHAAAGERGWLDFIQSETSRQHVLKITLSSDKFASREGGSEFGRPDEDDLADWNRAVEPRPQRAIADATLAVVKTKTDDKHGWLEAGQTMARTVLQAQALGLSWAFFNPVRRRAAREELRLGVGHKGYAQVILRFDPLTLGEAYSNTARTTSFAKFQ